MLYNDETAYVSTWPVSVRESRLIVGLVKQRRMYANVAAEL